MLSARHPSLLNVGMMTETSDELLFKTLCKRYSLKKPSQKHEKLQSQQGTQILSTRKARSISPCMRR
jgi:hypothetical protein